MHFTYRFVHKGHRQIQIFLGTSLSPQISSSSLWALQDLPYCSFCPFTLQLSEVSGSQGSTVLTVPCVVINKTLAAIQVLSQALPCSFRFNSDSSESEQTVFLEILPQMYFFSLQYSKQELLDNLFNSSFTTVGHQNRKNGLPQYSYILQCHRHNKMIRNHLGLHWSFLCPRYRKMYFLY